MHPLKNNQENNKPEVISDEEFDHFVLNMPEENLMPIPEVPRAVGEPMPDDGLDSFYLHYLDGFSQWCFKNFVGKENSVLIQSNLVTILLNYS